MSFNIGQYNTMEVVRQVDFGVYLDGGDEGDILLPKRYTPEGLAEGDSIKVFVYRDSEDRLIATTETPKITVGECAMLKVVAVNRIGAFLDWGLPKDLLVPFNQQAVRMEEGESYIVVPYVDEKTKRIAASSKLSFFLDESGQGFKVGQQVDLLIVSRSDLGFKAVINGTHLGLIFHSEVTKPVKVGQKTLGFIKQIRGEDQRIDLALDADRARAPKSLDKQILEFLEANDGVSTLTDKSQAKDILNQYGVSKGQYKKAIGGLYKAKKIVIGPEKISLNTKKK